MSKLQVRGILAGLALLVGLLVGCGTFGTNGPSAEGRRKARNSGMPILELRTDKDAWTSIQQQRKSALAAGSLNSGNHTWQDAVFHIAEWPADSSKLALEKGKAEIRLKGDWNDHLDSDQWSFRVKLKKSGRWEGKKQFSIMHPKVRHYLDEYAFHRVLEREDILTPAYDFAWAQVQSEPARVYAMEEHFRKELIEDRNRRDGILLKLDEDPLWDIRRLPNGKELDLLPVSEAAVILPFGDDNLATDPAFAARFHAAAAQLEAVRNGSQAVADIIDVDRWARFLAVVDLFDAYHSLIWHNIRFYANPVTGRLEPVAYDGFSEDGAFNWLTADNVVANTPWNDLLLRRITGDPAVQDAYRRHLERVSSTAYLDTLHTLLDSDLAERHAWLGISKSKKAFSWERLESQASLLQESLQDTAPWPTDSMARMWTDAMVKRKELPFYPGVSAVAWVSADSVWVASYFPDSLRVLAYGPSWLYRQELPLSTVPPYAEIGKPHRLAFGRKAGMPADSVYLQLGDGGDEGDWGVRLAIPVMPFAAPATNTLRESMQRHVWSADSVWLLEGRVLLDALIHVPPGGSVEVAPGTVITLSSGAGLVVESPILMAGQASQPILVLGRAGNHGLTLLGGATLQHVTLENLEALHLPGWQQTGALTIAEGPVALQHVSVLNAQAEDAVNLVRTKYWLDHLVVDRCLSDGLDIDFGRGRMSDCVFERIGNDAVDLSGTHVEASGISVRGAADKAISVGEHCMGSLSQLRLEDAIVGLSVKDGSRVSVTDASLRDCRLELAVFRKKPRFGMPSVSIENWEANGSEQAYLIESGSEVRINDQLVETFAPVELSALGY